MVLYRIGLKKHIRDLSGEGARRYGGRWNPKGVAVVYTSESVSLATVEYLVHLPLFLTSRRLMLAAMTVPDKIAPQEVRRASLPKNWKKDPPPPSLAAIGAEWVSSGTSLLLRVPSAIVETEHNYLVNPSHPDMKYVSVSAMMPYRFDERLLRENSARK